MTILAICLDIAILICLALIITFIASESCDFPVILTIILSVLFIVWIGGQFWYYSNTESGKRAIKSQQSNFNSGLKRQIKVYDVEGELIEEYEGKFDVDYDNDRIIFDDEKGLRHVIYYPTGTVIINELK